MKDEKLCYTLSMKILSPVGNFESLKMAIYYGADEIYLGVSDFNARNNIDGFSLGDLDRVVLFSHIFGVKVNLAVNILFRDNELDDATKLVVEAYNKGVDCFIIQDVGLASILHKNYPQIEIHASTQMGLHNLEGVMWARKLGFSRFVLARETGLDEIKRICDWTREENSKILPNERKLEVEYFVQGALCVSFSGNCYLSSYLCRASGNRGKCKQLCRLPYKLLRDGEVLKEGYLLSAKDFNMSDRLDELKRVGVDVLKIEGRARRPFYVAMSTKLYADALKGKLFDQNKMKLAFNRLYTAGYFDGNGSIISNYNNHIGVKIGKVTRVNVGKKFNEIYFTSSQNLSPKSAIKLFDEERGVSTISLFDLTKVGKDLYKATTTQKAFVGNFVNLISDFELEKEVSQFSKKMPLKITVRAYVEKPLSVKCDDLGEEISLNGEVLESAKSQPLMEKDVKDCFDKNEFFAPQIDFETDGVFVQKSKLNDIRREFYEKLCEVISNKSRHNLKPTKTDEPLKILPFEDFCFVETNEEIKNKSEKNIIFSPQEYREDEILKAREVCENLGKNFYLDLPNFALKSDIEMLKNLVEKNHISIVANNVYALDFGCEKVAGGGLNVFNRVGANFLGLKFVCAEESVAKQTNFPYMTLRHCPFKCDLGVTCKNCPYKDGEFALKMESGKLLKIKRKKLSSCTFYLTD